MGELTFYDEVEQGGDEWFALRLGSLGSSSAKAAMAGGMGKSRVGLAEKLTAEDITGLRSEGFSGSKQMLEGVAREPESRLYYELITGIAFAETGLIRNSSFPGQHTSPDGINKGLCVGLELKNPAANTMVRYLRENRMPLEYVQQVDHALLITGWDEWHFMAYHPAFDRQLIKIVTRDSGRLEKMREKIEKFMDEKDKIYLEATR